MVHRLRREATEGSRAELQGEVRRKFTANALILSVVPWGWAVPLFLVGVVAGIVGFIYYH
jgi:hypothetical protein